MPHGLLHVEARRAADKALELATAFGERGYEAHALHAFGEICAAGDAPDLDSAFSFCERARALAEELGMHPLLARCHLSLGQLSRRTGNRPKAQEHLTTAIAMLHEMDTRFWLDQAEAELK